MAANEFDVMIIGIGPAGITAAIYGQRLGLKTIAFGDIPGGNVYMVENLTNYPGFPDGIPGTQFGVLAFQQAQKDGATFPMTRLDRLTSLDEQFIGVDADDQEYIVSSVIIATGRVPVKLTVPNAGLKGVHFCSMCDGALYRDKNAKLAVIGSDNTAGQHALTLSRIADRVLLICRSKNLKMDALHRKLIESQKNIDILLTTEVLNYDGLDFIESIIVKTPQQDAEAITVDGVFLAIGWRPNTEMIELPVKTSPEGYLKTDSRLMTSFPGLFAAGDVRHTDMWQVLTACADGARAAKYAAEYNEKV